jgi:hypothetical protein
LVIDICESLNQLMACLICGILQVGRDLFDEVILALLGLPWPDKCLHLDEVDDADEVSLGTDRDLEDEWLRAKTILDHGDATIERCTGSIQLVDEADPWDLVLVSLTPDGLGLWLDTCDAIEDSDSAIKDTE